MIWIPLNEEALRLPKEYQTYLTVLAGEDCDAIENEWMDFRSCEELGFSMSFNARFPLASVEPLTQALLEYEFVTGSFPET
jgi:hypothetical protein